MKKPIYNLRGKVWLYPGMAGWHFVTLPKKQSKEIKQLFGGLLRRGWSSIPVIVTVGSTSWNTSIFPDKKADAYLLPLKSEVRKKRKHHAKQNALVLN
ncbi:hypothetical protein A2671_02145 [Candidatus Kaiserbacteria bacterium RIFCSPHIGHO2_01_FULL_49_13]|uniref:DUF1905 domain-containing protein n=1 Tax=Candidatus Kaiserbacteria bacterium RIFCSPHIGHO2_01_FULL_49_13 TaxID=1798477 RepID=A0A1F6CDE3_9BACT|nr:MAG: hypothetical protein A2671_02145 [Candidatus Kaiserbacteria bacterium RIFCSPHIGHO2_01_FULL_49_13]